MAPLGQEIVRHAVCALAFTIRWFFILLAVAAVGATLLIGGLSAYIFIAQYGFVPFIVTTGLMGAALGLLIAAGVGLIWFMEWAEGACR